MHGADAVVESDLLGCGDDDGACEWEQLAQGEGDITGARGQVNDEVVERWPEGVIEEELFEGAVSHGAAPDEGFVLIDEAADGDGMDAVDGVWEEFGAVHRGELSLDAEHGGHGGPVDIAIHESDGGAMSGKSDGDIDGDGGFSDAALSGADSDDIFDLREDLLLILRRAGGGGEFDVNALGADAFEGLLDVVFDGGFHGAGGGCEFDAEIDGVIADFDVFDHIEGDQVFVEVGVIYGSEGRHDLFVVECHSVSFRVIGGRIIGVWGRFGIRDEEGDSVRACYSRPVDMEYDRRYGRWSHSASTGGDGGCRDQY